MLNNRHHTPLMLAVSEGRSSLIELLVSKGSHWFILYICMSVRVDLNDSWPDQGLFIWPFDHMSFLVILFILVVDQVGYVYTCLW